VLHALANWSSRGYVSAMLAAQVHAALGDTDAALEALAHAMEQRATNLAWVGVHPAFAPVRNDARFVALLNRMGFTALPADPRPAPR
jgi:hypothetical protein